MLSCNELSLNYAIVLYCLLDGEQFRLNRAALFSIVFHTTNEIPTEFFALPGFFYRDFFIVFF